MINLFGGDQIRKAHEKTIRDEGIKAGIERGIEALIIDNIEDGKSEQEIIEKLIRRFNLTEEKAKKYYDELH